MGSTFHLPHSEYNICFKCSEGQYKQWVRDSSYWDLPETDTVKCNKCGHLCPSFIYEGDIIVDNRAVIKELLYGPMNYACSGPIDKVISVFTKIKEDCKEYFYTFVDYYGGNYQHLGVYGFRLETNDERTIRLLDEHSQQISNEQKELAQKQERYAKYLLLKEKYGK